MPEGNTPVLENKRFNPSERSLQMMKSARDVLYEKQKQFPALSGFGFYGSRTKGTDRPNSDLDLVVFYNSDVKTSINTPSEFMNSGIFGQLTQRAETTIHAMFVDISQKATVDAFEAFVDVYYFDKQRDATPGDHQNERAYWPLVTQFFLAVGDDVYGSRRFALDLFKDLPDGEREEAFKSFMSCLAKIERPMRENKPSDPEYNNYPSTVDEAEKYFVLRDYAHDNSVPASDVDHLSDIDGFDLEDSLQILND